MTQQNTDIKKDLILVVDDDDDVNNLLDTVLSKKGYQVLTASDGVEGIKLVEAHSPDLIISDIIMPNLDGFEFLCHLRQHAEHRHIPFIFLSQMKNVPEKAMNLNIAADYYIGKPFDWKKIVARIQKIFELRDKALELQKARSKGFNGDLSNLSLLELLQIMELGSKTGRLMVSHDNHIGEIHICQGKVCHAELNAKDEATGLEAVHQLLEWKEGTFVFDASFQPETTKALAKISNLLLNWVVSKDHQSRPIGEG